MIEFEGALEDGTTELANFVDQLPPKQRRRLKLVDLKVDIKKLQEKSAAKLEESTKDVKMAKKVHKFFWRKAGLC